jgi:TP901 family phage tail tape measure protein
MARYDVELRAGFNVDESSLLRGVNEAASKINNMRMSPQIDARGIEAFSRPLGRITGQADEFTKSMEAANARVIAFGASVGTLNAIVQSFKNIITISADVEEALNQIVVASNNINADNVNELSQGLFNVAKSTGQSFKIASEAALEFSRQGKTLKETLDSTRAALALTRLTGLDATQAVRGLTAAVNAFSEEGLSYADVVNRMAAVDTNFAVSSKDLIEGISRSASVAQEAGVSFNELTGLITTLQERTARGGAVIGNALKTIFTRVQTTDNLKYLRDLGFELYDVEGRILPVVDIMKKLANTMDSLDSATRKTTLLKIGGGFQVDRLAAVLKGFQDQANGTFSRATDVAANAGSNAFDRLEKLNQTTLTSFNNLITSGEKLASILGGISLSPQLKTGLDTLTKFTDILSTKLVGDASKGENEGSKIGTGLVKGITNVITGPGLALGALLVGKVVMDLGKFAYESTRSLIGVNTASKQKELIEKSITSILQTNLSLHNEIFNEQKSEAEQLKVIDNILTSHIKKYEQIASFSKSISPILATQYEIQQKGLSFKSESMNAASGFLPANVAYKLEKQNTPPGHRVINDPNFPIGGGKTVNMFYNSSETRKVNYKGSGGDAIIPNFAKNNAAEVAAQQRAALLAGGEQDFSNLIAPSDRKKTGKTLNINALQAGIGGLTIASSSPFISRKQNIESVETQKAIKRFNPLQAAYLNSFDSITLQSLPVGYVYNRVGKAESGKDNAKEFFKTKLNATLNASVLDFTQQELAQQLGIKIDERLLTKLKLQSARLNLINDTAAGSIFESMVATPLLSTDADIVKFVNRGADENFDLLNLSSNLAEKYNLPKQNYPYVEVKSDVSKLQEHIVGKFLNQASKDGRLQALLGLNNASGQNLIAQNLIESKAPLIEEKSNARKALEKSNPYLLLKALQTGALSSFAGFIPNFADPLNDAIKREQDESGLPLSAISVVKDSSLKNTKNPMGFAVINSRDEPNGKIPNFAAGDDSKIETKISQLLTNLDKLVKSGMKSGSAETKLEPDISKLTESKKGSYIGNISREKLQEILNFYKDTLSLAETLAAFKLPQIDTTQAAAEQTVEEFSSPRPKRTRKSRAKSEPQLEGPSSLESDPRILDVEAARAKAEQETAARLLASGARQMANLQGATGQGGKMYEPPQVEEKGPALTERELSIKAKVSYEKFIKALQASAIAQEKVNSNIIDLQILAERARNEAKIVYGETKKTSVPTAAFIEGNILSAPTLPKEERSRLQRDYDKLFEAQSIQKAQESQAVKTTFNPARTTKIGIGSYIEGNMIAPSTLPKEDRSRVQRDYNALFQAESVQKSSTVQDQQKNNTQILQQEKATWAAREAEIKKGIALEQQKNKEIELTFELYENEKALKEKQYAELAREIEKGLSATSSTKVTEKPLSDRQQAQQENKRSQQEKALWASYEAELNAKIKKEQQINKQIEETYAIYEKEQALKQEEYAELAQQIEDEIALKEKGKENYAKSMASSVEKQITGSLSTRPELNIGNKELEQKIRAQYSGIAVGAPEKVTSLEDAQNALALILEKNASQLKGMEAPIAKYISAILAGAVAIGQNKEQFDKQKESLIKLKEQEDQVKEKLRSMALAFKEKSMTSADIKASPEFAQLQNIRQQRAGILSDIGAQATAPDIQAEILSSQTGKIAELSAKSAQALKLETEQRLREGAVTQQVTKSIAESAAKLFILETAIQGLSGVLSEFGDIAKSIGDGFSAIVRGYYSFGQLTDIGNSVRGKKRVFDYEKDEQGNLLKDFAGNNIIKKDKDGKDIIIETNKTFGDLFSNVKKGFIAARDKNIESGSSIPSLRAGLSSIFGTSESAAGMAGGGFGNTFKLLASATTIAGAAIFGLVQGLSALDNVIVRFNGSIERGKILTGALTQLNEIYATSLSETQRQAIERTKNSAVTSTGLMGDINKMPEIIAMRSALTGDSNERLMLAQEGLGISKEDSETLLKQLGTKLAPIAEQKVRAEKGLKETDLIDVQDLQKQLNNDLIDFINRVKVSVGTPYYSYAMSTGTGAVEKKYSEQDYLNLPEKRRNDPQFVKKYDVNQNLVASAITRETVAIAEQAAKAAEETKRRQSAFGLGVEVEKERLNIIQQIAKAQDSISSNLQNELTIRRDLNSTSEGEKSTIDFLIKKEQERKNAISETRQVLLTSGKKQIEERLTGLGAAFKETMRPELENIFQNLANAEGSQEQLDAFSQLLNFTNKLGAGAKELTDLLKEQFKQVQAASAARELQSVIEFQNISFVKQQNFELQKQKDLITSTLNARIKIAELDSQKRELGYQTTDLRFQASQTLSLGSPMEKQINEAFKASSDNAMREREKLDAEVQRNELQNRSNLLNLVMGKTGDMAKVNQVANTPDIESAVQLATKIINEEGDKFYNAVVNSANEFGELVIKAGEQLNLIINGQATGNDAFDRSSILLSRGALPEDKGALIKLQNEINSIASSMEYVSGNEEPNSPSRQFIDKYLPQLQARLEEVGKALEKAKETTKGEALTPSQVKNQANFTQIAVAERQRQISATAFNDFSKALQTTYTQASSLEKEYINMRLNGAQKALDLEKEKLNLLNTSESARFSVENMTMNPYEAQKAKSLFDIEQAYRTTNKTYAIDVQKAALSERQSAVNYLGDKVPISELRSVASGEKKPTDAVNDFLTKSKNTLYTGITSAASKFYEIVTNAAYVSAGKNPSGVEGAALQASNTGLSENNILQNKSLLSEEITKLAEKQALSKAQLNQSFGAIELARMSGANTSEVEKEISTISSDIQKNDGLIKQYTDALKMYDETLGSINALKSEGKLTDQQARDLLGAPTGPSSQVPKTAGDVRQSGLAMRSYDAYLNETVGGGMTKATQAMQVEITKFQSTLGETIPMAFRDGLVSAMKAATDGTKSLKEGLLGVALAFGQKINDVLMQNLANQITAPLTKAFTPTGFAAGGYISRGSGNKDDVPAMLMKGEYVLNKNAVSKYGAQFFEDLNSGKVKKFASGGIVGGEIDITKPLDTNLVPYGETRSGGLSFNKDGSVIGMDNYTGREEDKGDALKRAQTGFYSNNAQTGEGGFYTPGQYGKGAIMGQKNLLSFVTQQTVSDQYDTIKGSRGGASIDLAGGSSNLTIRALMNQENLRNKEYTDAKSKALDLYFGGIDAAKSKTKQDEDNRIAYEKALAEREKQKKEQEKQFIKGLVTQIATTVAMAGLSAAASSMANGMEAGKQQAVLEGRKAGFMEGALSGGKIDGQQYGGLRNMFNSSGYQNANLLGAKGGGALIWSSKEGSYQPMTTEDYNSMFPQGVSWKNSSGGNLYAGKPISYSWRKAAGGYIPGRGLGDDVPAMLTGGEFVMSKQASSNIGYGNLQRMNSTGTSESNQDGIASRIESKLEELFEKVTGVGSIEINIESNGSENSSSKEDSGKDAQSRELAKKVKDVVLNVLREEKRLGGMLR